MRPGLGKIAAGLSPAARIIVRRARYGWPFHARKFRRSVRPASKAYGELFDLGLLSKAFAGGYVFWDLTDLGRMVQVFLASGTKEESVKPAHGHILR